MEKAIIIPKLQFDINLSLMPDIGISDSSYMYNGKIVPRVTHVLSEMLHEDSLMGWSNYIGLYKRQKYKEVLDRAADIGSHTHNAIEKYLVYNEKLDSDTIPLYIRTEVVNTYSAFLEWWKYVSEHNVEIIMQEQPMSCPYYGGTLDLLIKIDGKIYLVDFKTSNHIGYKYYLQLAAYRRMLYTEYGIDIDGCILLQLSKTSPTFNEYMIDLYRFEDQYFMIQCDQAFLSLVYAYYHRHNVINLAKPYL